VMDQSPPRIPLIARDEWTDAARDVFAVMDGEEAWKNGSRFNIVNILAHHPAVAVPFMRFNRSLLFDTQLAPRLREIAVLRIAHLSRSEYEWVQHVRIGTSIGLTTEDIAAVKAGEPARHWSSLDSLVLQAVDELQSQDTISDCVWAGLAKQLDQRLLLELLWIIGGYKASAWIFNELRVPLEESNPIRVKFSGA
jgi:4-carboxymuconolactone decarboxylase